MIVQVAANEALRLQDVWKRQLDDKTQVALFLDNSILLIAITECQPFRHSGLVAGRLSAQVRSRFYRQVEEEAEKRQELLEEVQPMADRFAEAMVTRKYSDSLVQGYVSSLGQSLVPPDSPASTTFSFRVVQDIYPNASALPDGRIYLTTGMLAHVENEAQLAMVLGHEIGHVIEEHALESLRRRRSVVSSAGRRVAGPPRCRVPREGPPSALLLRL